MDWGKRLQHVLDRWNIRIRIVVGEHKRMTGYIYMFVYIMCDNAVQAEEKIEFRKDLTKSDKEEKGEYGFFLLSGIFCLRISCASHKWSSVSSVFLVWTVAFHTFPVHNGLGHFHKVILSTQMHPWVHLFQTWNCHWIVDLLTIKLNWIR